MGFREYNPSLNRFLSRDMYDGALKDMALGSDPWNSNRYAFAGGNPITGIELDGHCAMGEDGGCDENAGYTGPVQPQPAATSSPTPVPNNVGQEINESMGLPAEASPQQQAIRTSQLGITPAIAGFKLGAEEFARTGLDEGLELLADLSGIKDAETCIADFEKTACAWTAMSVTPLKIGKLGKLTAVTTGSRLAEASRSAFRASENPGTIFIKDKHLAGFGGRYGKFDSTDIGEVQGWVAEGLRSDGAIFKPNGLEGTFKVEVDMGRAIGTKGQTGIRAIVTDDGRVINAFPFNAR
ncbi:hypothetical protein GCM10009789_54680 [Kribbella sancticallisti]|uniref:RHS repeat-associated core domain-containing protein n=2 Tax=Kribbella sancticallisti TaxID=460087 RepID=A0ABP4PZG6_9ACTN